MIKFNIIDKFRIKRVINEKWVIGLNEVIKDHRQSERKGNWMTNTTSTEMHNSGDSELEENSSSSCKSLKVIKNQVLLDGRIHGSVLLEEKFYK